MSGRSPHYQRVLHDANIENQRSIPLSSSDFTDTKGLLSPENMGSDSAYSPNPLAGQYTSPYSTKPSPTVEVQEDDGDCNARTGYRKPGVNGGDIVILILAIYSTICSCLWLILSILGPQYHFIGTEGVLSPTVASTIVAILAKSIELSFVTVFVSFLGQKLSRQALSSKSNGITLADMNLRTYVLQPGLIVSSWHGFGYSVRTALGILTLIATIVSLFYTTASDALVSPQLNLRKPEIRYISSNVVSSFANNKVIRNSCPSPVNPEKDVEADSGSSCASIEHAGQSYHNYLQYLAAFQNLTATPIEDRESLRPPPTGMLFDNTTATGDWLYPQTPVLSKQRGRIINNVTMAFPHAGVYTAAMNNTKIRQGTGPMDPDTRLLLEAEVVSPTINVLCALATEDELRPMIFSEWPVVKNNKSELSEIWSKYPNFYEYANETGWKKELKVPADFDNTTVLDDIFGYGGPITKRPRPVFAKFPEPSNTLFNFTDKWGTDSLHVLIATNGSDNGLEKKTLYTVCSLRAATAQGCSTRLDISVGGGKIAASCNEKSPLTYNKPEQVEVLGSIDWVGVGFDWGTSISLGDGIRDGKSANARMLAELVPRNENLDPNTPTIAEALAVLAGCTVMISSQGAPFDNNIYTGPGMVEFKAEMQISRYMSGVGRRWQKMFNTILAAAFLINVYCLGYHAHLFRTKGLVSDFLEWKNMFSLALHSPADRRLAGTSASGPEKHHLREPWFIKEDYHHQLFIGDKTRRRGHASWMSHAPATTSPSNPIPMVDASFDQQEPRPPKTYRPGIKDSIKNSLGLKINLGNGRKKSNQGNE